LRILARKELSRTATIADVASLVKADVNQLVCGQTHERESANFAEGFVTGALVVFAERFWALA
jgi:hypothetical protein